MKVNYKEGMFLGKEELQRVGEIDRILSVSHSYFQHAEQTAAADGSALFDLSQHFIKSTIINSKLYLYVSANNDDLAGLGRVVIGYNSEKKEFGLPVYETGLAFYDDEASLDLSSLVTTNSYYVWVTPAETNYENAAITITANGEGTLLNTTAKFRELFRGGAKGTKIKTSSGQVLTVNSINGTSIVFKETSCTAETRVRFMFVHTMSPFSSDGQNVPIYTYSTSTLSATTSSYPDTDRKKFIIGLLTYQDNNWVFTLGDYNVAGYKWMGVVTGNSLIDNTVKNVKLYNDTIEKSKMSIGAFGYKSYTRMTSGVDLVLNPNQIGEFYQENGYLGVSHIKFKSLIDSSFVYPGCVTTVLIGKGYLDPASPTSTPMLAAFFEYDSSEARSVKFTRNTTGSPLGILTGIAYEGSSYQYEIVFYWVASDIALPMVHKIG